MSIAESSARIGTQSDISKTYKVSIITVKRWAREGIIVPVVRIGNVVRYDLDDVARRLRAHAARRPTRGAKQPGNRH